MLKDEYDKLCSEYGKEYIDEHFRQFNCVPFLEEAKEYCKNKKYSQPRLKNVEDVSVGIFVFNEDDVLTYKLILSFIYIHPINNKEEQFSIGCDVTIQKAFYILENVQALEVPIIDMIGYYNDEYEEERVCYPLCCSLEKFNVFGEFKC